jgi:transposase
MDSQPPDLPDDIDALRAVAAVALARNADDAATIARQNLEIAKLKRQIYGPRSERTARLIDQMELELEDLEGAAT